MAKKTLGDANIAKIHLAEQGSDPTAPDAGYFLYCKSGGVYARHYSGDVVGPFAAGGGGLPDPGSNGIVTRTGAGATGIAEASDVVGLFSGSGTYLKTDGTQGTPAGSGDVVGPGSAADGNLAVFDGTSGKLLKDGGAPSGGGGADFLVVQVFS